MKRALFILVLTLAVVLSTGVVLASQAGQASPPLFAGKTIELAVPFGPGGSTDIVARLVARYLGRHIPGNPTVIVQNRPGAGGLVGMRYVYEAAKPDGLTIAATSDAYHAWLLKDPAAKHDLSKMTLLAGMAETEAFYVRKARGVTSLEGLRKLAEPLIVANFEKNSLKYPEIRLPELLLGLHFKYVFGYKGTGAARAALQRSEVDGYSETVSVLQQMGWLKEGPVQVLWQLGMATPDGRFKRDPRVPEIPTVEELAGERARGLLWSAFQVMGREYSLLRTYSLPPGVPPERVQALRRAFEDTFKDPEFVAEAKKILGAFFPVVGAELELLHQGIIGAPRDALDYLQRLARE